MDKKQVVLGGAATQRRNKNKFTHINKKYLVSGIFYFFNKTFVPPKNWQSGGPPEIAEPAKNAENRVRRATCIA